MRILEHNALFVERDTPVHIDVSDISKPHAGKMPCLCKVRDASDPRKPIRRVGRLAMTLLRPADGPQVVRSLKARLPGDHRPLLYVAVPRKGNDPRPLKLLARLGEGQVDLEAWPHKCRSFYRRRWRAEDGVRFLKSEVSLERV